MNVKRGEAAGSEDQDGDFIALRSRREVKTAEPVELDEEITSAKQVHRPRTAIARSLNEGATTSAATDRLFQDIESVTTDQFVSLFNELPNFETVLDPTGNMNILLYVLAHGRLDLAKLVLPRTHADLLVRTCDVVVASLSGKKNVLHYVTEKFDVEMAKSILNKIPDEDMKKRILKEETPVEIEGQRPRTLPCCHLAAFYGCRELVILYLSHGVDVNAVNSKKDTALLWASRWNHLDVVEELLNRQAKCDIQNDKGSTALYWAVRYGHTQCVSILIEKGNANVNQTRKLGLVSPIIVACALGYTEIVQRLVKAGADPHQKIRGDERPIHHAAREGYSEIMTFLLDAGAVIDDPDEAGDTALLQAARHGHARCVQLLLAKGANYRHVNHIGEDLMSLAVDSDNTSVLKIALQFATKRGETGGSRSPLLLAAAGGEVDKMLLLLQAGLDPMVTDEEGNTLMHYAAAENRHQVIIKFQDRVKIDAQNKKGNTAMHNACSGGHAEAIEALMVSKAQASIKNNLGETALHVAAACKQILPENVRRLMDYVIKSHAWEALNIKDSQGNNALHVAARFARPEVMWEFRHVSIKAKDSEGNIALHEAVRGGEPEALSMMLDIYEAAKRDADINEANNKQETVLHLAAREGFAEHIGRLVLLGADLSSQNQEGNSVLHILTHLSARLPSKSKMYLTTFQAVLDQALVWWCMKYKQQYPHAGSSENSCMIGVASMELLTEVFNNNGRSVFAMACQEGAVDVVSLILSRKNVMCYDLPEKVLYNVTNMTPLTSNSITGCCGKGAGTTKPSYIEFLLSLEQKDLACKVLDVQPFREIEKVYSSVAAVTYVILMLVHIVYMTLLSYSGVSLLERRRQEPSSTTVDAATVFLYVVAPVEPAIILLYNLFKLIKVIGTGQLPPSVSLTKVVKYENHLFNFVYLSAPYVLGVIYSVLVVLWIVFFIVDISEMDFIFSVAVCIGWMYTISFTRGIRIIHYFWRMIQNMIVKDIFKFLFIYLFVLLAFTFAFHAVFQVSSDVAEVYSSPMDTGFLVFNLMIGMTDLFTDKFEISIEPHRRLVFIKVLYLVYIVLATILLLNLLIAMMNDSYSSILQQHSVSWRVESVQLGVDIEKVFPASTRLFSRTKFIRNPPEVVTPVKLSQKKDQRQRNHDIGNSQTKDHVYGHRNHVRISPYMPEQRDIWCIAVPVEKVHVADVDSEQTERDALREIKHKMAAIEQRICFDLQQLKHDIDEVKISVKNMKPAKQ